VAVRVIHDVHITSEPSRDPTLMPNQSPPPGHLPAETLAGYIDRSLPAPTQASVDAHLADCARCRAELVAAKRLVHAAPAARSTRGPLLAVAAIAATILVVVLIRPATSPDERMRSTAPSSAVEANALTVVTPSTAAAVAPTDLRFVWKPGASVIEYTLTVMDADGRTRWSTSTSDTSVALPDSVALAPGSTIYWYVDGLRADGRSVGTGRQRLTVR
jgi:hypothetical protein